MIVRRNVLFLFSALLLLFIGHAAWAKGTTLKIKIMGPGLIEPIEVTDPDLVSQFSIWNGPGTSVQVTGEPARMGLTGAFVDWPAGALASRPSELISYDVMFYIDRDPSETEDNHIYKVTYEFDAAGPGGYMYIPTGSEALGNTELIYHGVEGNWFNSSPAWENLIRPLIEDAVNIAPQLGR